MANTTWWPQMKNIVALILLVGGVALAYITWTGYQKAERAQQQADALRELVVPSSDYSDDASPSQPEPEVAYDPADLDQTPPGVTPFIPTTVCYAEWGNRLRQYCEGGDSTALELIEGGDDQAESMRVLVLCLDELLQQIDTYETDDRPMDSDVELSEANRKELACELTTAYGDSPVFNNGSVYYLIKEHMESGNISRLENR